MNFIEDYIRHLLATGGIGPVAKFAQMKSDNQQTAIKGWLIQEQVAVAKEQTKVQATAADLVVRQDAINAELQTPIKVLPSTEPTMETLA